MPRRGAADEPFVVELLDREGDSAPAREATSVGSRRGGAGVVAAVVALLLLGAAAGSVVWSPPAPPPERAGPPAPRPERFEERLATRLEPCGAAASTTACVRWSVAAFRDTIRPVGAADGALVVADDLVLRAFEARTGVTRWVTRSFHEPDAIAMGDGVVVVAERRMRPESLSLVAMSAANAAPMWEATVGGTFGPPIVGAGVVLVHDRERLVALDAQGAQRRWEHDLAAALAAPPVAVDDIVVIGTNDSDVTAIDVATGAVRWRTTLLSRLRHPAVVLDNAVVLATGKGLVGLDRDTGGLRWTRLPTYPTGWMAGSSDVVVVEAGPVLLGLDGLGAQRWRTRLPAVPSRETLADGVAYLAVNRSLMAVATVDGRIMWEVPLFGQWPVAPPAAAGGVVLVGVDDEVVALT